MNIKEYIASGILDSYVLGLLADKEKAEVEQMAAASAEIRGEIRAIEDALEKYALSNAEAPPTGLKEQIWSKIEAESEAKIAKVVALYGNEAEQEPAPKLTGFFGKYFNAAASLALLGSLLVNLYLGTQWKTSKENLSLAIKENIQLQKQSKDQNGMMMPNEVNMLMNPTVKMSKLVGQKGSENSTVMLAWDTKTNKIYVVRGNLPPAPTGMQYQLWAIVNDKPIDAGVFDVKNDMQELKTIQSAKVFAVTLEKKGGSPAPTSDIMVMGI